MTVQIRFLCIIIILLIVGGIFLFKKDKTSDKKEKVLKEQNYTMYVSINPLVKFVFKETLLSLATSHNIIKVSIYVLPLKSKSL